MPSRAVEALVVMAVLMAFAMIVANLCAMKIWSFLNTPVDGGIILFPLTYVVGDLLCEIYGKRTADRVAWLSFMTGLGATLMLYLVGALPDYPSADNQAFDLLLAGFNRVMIASMTSYLAGQLLNNWVFEQVRRRHKQRSRYLQRSLSSSLIAHLVDAVVFETLAFLGRLPLAEFIMQAVFAFLAGLIIEVGLVPINLWLRARLTSYLQFYNGKRAET